MTITYYPFDGADVYQAQWTKMFSPVQSGVVAGIGDGLEVYGDSSGMQVKVRSGRAFIKGHTMDSDATSTLAIAAADPSNARWDLVVVKLDWVNKTISLVVKTGTPAGSPALPSVTESSTVWEIPLAKVIVDAGATTIAAAKVIDRRIACNLFKIPFLIGDGVTVITAGVKAVIPVRFPLILHGWQIEEVTATSGSITFDIWVDYYGNTPAVADTIISSGKPLISSAVRGVSVLSLGSGGISTWSAGMTGVLRPEQYDNGLLLSVNADATPATVKKVCLTLLASRR